MPGSRPATGSQTSRVKSSTRCSKVAACSSSLLPNSPVQAALRHRDLVGEAPDREALEPVDRGAAQRHVEDLGPGVGDGGGGAARHRGA